MDENLRKSIILENYSNPVNKKTVDDKRYKRVNMNSKTCIDNLDFACKFKDDVIEDIKFDGEACAISTSAASIMINTLIGKTKEEALKILQNYQNMIDEAEYDKDLLGELNVYEDICKQPNRKTCAMLPKNAISYMLNELK